MFLNKNIVLICLLSFMFLLIVYQLFFSSCITEGMDNNDGYNDYGDNLQVLVNKNSGNIDFLKGQVDNLNTTSSQLTTSVTNLTSQVQTLQNQVQNMTNAQQSYLNPALSNQSQDEEEDDDDNSSPVQQDASSS
jgi:hypothetical protein